MEYALARRDELAGGIGMDDLLLGLGAIALTCIGIATGFWMGYRKQPEPPVVVPAGVDPERARKAGQQHEHTWGRNGKLDGVPMAKCSLCGKAKQWAEVTRG